MPQIQKGTTYSAINNLVNFTNLNNLVDSSTLLNGAITEQSAMTVNTVASADSVLLYDLSAVALRRPTVGDVLNSNLPITTSAISGGAGVDLVITPIATYKVDVAGAFEADSINSVGATTVGGTFGVTGAFTASSTLAVTGTTTLTGATTVGSITTNGTVTANGTVNITGAIQYNGTPVFGLYEVAYEQIPEFNATVAGNQPAVWTSNAFTKPSDEIWVFELDYHYTANIGYSIQHGARYASQTLYTGTYKFLEFDVTVNSNSYVIRNKLARWVEGVGITLTAETVKIDASCPTFANLKMFFTATSSFTIAPFCFGQVNGIAPSIFRIYKYKTA